MFEWLWNYLVGYVIIKVEGLSLERFLNAALECGVKIWEVERKSYITITAKIHPKGFKRLRKVLRASRCKVHILKKRGLPFFFNSLRFRKALIYGGVVITAILCLALQLIWSFEVRGTVTVDANEILETVDDAGVRQFMPNWQLDRDALERKIRSSNEKIAWVGIHVQGVKLVIEIVEGEPAPELVDKDTPANIIADKDAMIKSITVLEGKGLVKAGDVVKKGDMLITGEYKRDNEPSRYVHARGEVVAQIWYTGEATVSSDYKETARTGNSNDSVKICMAGWIIPGEKEFQLYESELKYNGKLKGLFIPLNITVERHYELREQTKVISEEERKALAEAKAFEIASGKVPKTVQIVKMNTKFTTLDNGIKAQVTLETEEPLGTTELIK